MIFWGRHARDVKGGELEHFFGSSCGVKKLILVLRLATPNIGILGCAENTLYINNTYVRYNCLQYLVSGGQPGFFFISNVPK
jgi:hypothetical protein